MSQRTLYRHPDVLPVVQVEITTACNLRCQGCARTIFLQRGEHRTRHMPLEGFKAVIATLPPTGILILQGNGEPLLHPHLLEMIEIARQSEKIRTILFNSNLLARDEIYILALRRAGLSQIMVSIDSFNQETADLCRGGTDVALLKARIERLAPFVPLGVSVTVSRDNLADLLDIVSWINSRLDNARVDFQRLNPVPQRSDGRDPSLRPEDLATFAQIIDQMRRKFPLVSLAHSSDLDETRGKVSCSMPFRRPFITVDGDLCPCCYVADPSAYKKMNLFTVPFEIAWMSSAVQDWLAEFTTSVPEICRHCGSTYLPPVLVPA